MNEDRTRAAIRQTATNDAGTAVTAYLLAGPLTFGGMGYGLDAWLGTRGFVAVGVLSGLALALYTIWFRYGGGERSPESEPHSGGAPSKHSGGTISNASAPRTTIEETT